MRDEHNDRVPVRFMETSRWVEEEALQHVGQVLSDDELVSNDNEDEGVIVVSSTGRQGISTHAQRSSRGIRTDQRDDRKSWQSFLVHMGPGFLMCIAYIDPGNLEADLQTGVVTGYSLLWVLLWSTVLGGLLQSLAAKLGVSTSRHLAQHCRDMYPGPMRILLWLMAELAIIGSDIQEVIGSSLAIMLLTRGAMPLWAGVITGAVTAYLLLFLEKFGLQWLEGFFQLLVGTLGVCMAVLFFAAKVPYGKVFQGLAIPKLDSASLPTATGLLGAIIMPHNLFLHSALVHERGIPPEHRSTAKHSLWYYKVESAVALFVTLAINTSVISVFAHGFHGTDEKIGLYNAGQFLGNKYGAGVAMVWAVGLLAAGQSSTMTGTYAGQFVMSGFLDLKMGPYNRALMTRAVALVPTMIVALVYDAERSGSFTGLDILNQWLNILQAIQLPFAIIPLLALTANASVVGLGFVNSYVTNVVCVATASVIIIINALTAYQTALSVLSGCGMMVHLLFWAVVLGYLSVVAYLAYLSLQSLGESHALDPLLSQDYADDEEMNLGTDDDGVVKAAGTFVPPIVPRLNIDDDDMNSEVHSESRARSIASSSIMQSSRAGTQSHVLSDAVFEASP
jgi:natural resistance-associated macrophage protein 2